MVIDEIERKLDELVEKHKIPNYIYGIAGSYARGEQTAESDIDIVVKDGLLTLDEMEEIKTTFMQSTDVLQMVLLKKEDEELDAMLQEMDLPTNNDSVYKTISQEVIWFETK